MSRGVWLALIAAVAFVAAVAGTYVGRAWFADSDHSETELHAFLHGELDLDAAQMTKIDMIEKRYAARRAALEREMRSANAHLATAMEAEHGYGPDVTAAVDHTHRVMGEMQKETLEHLFAMRSVLTPAQAKRFDRAVTEALAPPAK